MMRMMTRGTTVLLMLAGALAHAEDNTNQFWWPERLDLAPLRQHAQESNPAALAINLNVYLAVAVFEAYAFGPNPYMNALAF